MVEIFAIRLIDDEAFSKVKPCLSEHLPENVIEKLGRFRNPPAMQRNMLGEVLCRAVVAQKEGIPAKTVSTYRTEKGKPYYTDLKQWHFNISHSAEWVVMAFSDEELGIDIEKIKPINYHLAKRFFSGEENVRLNEFEEPRKLHYFFDLWTLKESYLKYLGKGLTKSLRTFTIHDVNGRFFLKHDEEHDSDVHFRQFVVGGDCKLSVCADSETFAENILFLTIDELLTLLT